MRHMAFEDVAKRMKPGRGGQVADAQPIDPDQIIAEAQRAARRSARTSDLILGPMLLAGGAGILWLCYAVAKQGGYMYGMVVAAVVAISIGFRKVARAIGLVS